MSLLPVNIDSLSLHASASMTGSFNGRTHLHRRSCAGTCPLAPHTAGQGHLLRTCSFVWVWHCCHAESHWAPHAALALFNASVDSHSAQYLLQCCEWRR